MPVLQWMGQADLKPFPDWPMHWAWWLLAIYCALYFPAAIFLTRLLLKRTRLPLVVAFPVAWVALEYVRSFLLTGFAWYYLAHSQHDYLSMIQVADLGGVYAVSLLIAAVNAIVFDILYQFPEVRAFLSLRQPPAVQRTFGDDWPGWRSWFFATWRRGIMLEGCGVAVLVGAAYLYGSWRLEQAPAPPGPMVACLQGSLDQRLRNDAELPADRQAADKVRQQQAMRAKLEITGHYQALCLRVRECQEQPDLFIWPETSDPAGWVEVAKEMPINEVPERWRLFEENNRLRLRDAYAPLRTPQLLGISTYFLDIHHKPHPYNSALLVNGFGQAETRYDKMHRVPFGEYVPLRHWLPFMNWFAPVDFDYSLDTGEHFTRFVLDKYRFGVLICYEDTDPFLARHYARSEDDGQPVDFLVNISNDGWFNGSSEHEEHLAVSRFRAIECRRALVRSVNMGISAVIDGNGRVLAAPQVDRPAQMLADVDQPLPDAVAAAQKLPIWAVQGVGGPVPSMPHAEWAERKQVAGVLMSYVPIDGRYSFYAFAGDWLAGLCWLIIAFGTVGVWVYGRLRPRTA